MQLSDLLAQSYQRLRKRRQQASCHSDIWSFCRCFAQRQASLQNQLLAGSLRLQPMLVVGRSTEKKAVWSAVDRLVLKALSLLLAHRLPQHARCQHSKGHGGCAGSRAQLRNALHSKQYGYVLRTDVRGYYANINKQRLWEMVEPYLPEPYWQAIFKQYLYYTVEYGGTFHTPEKGICRGCPLSPLLGGFYLYQVDKHFAQQQGIYYARYMDDFVLLTSSKWQLRQKVKELHAFFNQFTLTFHPDKTFIGKITKGFDWLGGNFTDKGVIGVAPRALANHHHKLRQLYRRCYGRQKMAVYQQVAQYRRRWASWANQLWGRSGLALGVSSLLNWNRGPPPCNNGQQPLPVGS